MKSINCIGLTGLLLLPCVGHALEWNQDWSDWEIRPYATGGFMQYEFELESTNIISEDGFETIGGFDAKDSMLLAGIGVSAFLGNFFVDVAIQKTDEGSDDFSQERFGFGISEFGLVPFASQQNGGLDMEREEFSVSAGYALTDRFGLFAGYKKTETSFDTDATLEAFIGASGLLEALSRGDTSFDQDGFFLGTTYVWPFESDGWLNGALSVDLGLALLDGEVSTKANVTSLDGVPIDDPIGALSFDGDSLGVNIGVTWNAPLTDRLSYSVGVDGYKYDYESDSDEAGDFQDTVLRFAVGVSYAMDARGIR